VTALVLVLAVGCARFGPANAPSAAGSGSGMQTDCGGTDQAVCDRIVEAALRMTPPDRVATRIEVTQYHDRGIFACPSVCPSYGPEVRSGATLHFADGETVDFNCIAFVSSEREAASALDFPLSCISVDHPEERYANIIGPTRNESGLDVNFYVLGGASGGGGAPGGCGLQRVGVPFSFYLTGSGPHGEDVGEWHEVFRSEEIGNPTGDLYLRITITAADEVVVEQLDKRPACADFLDEPH
jgi:hypothetical protein